MRENKLPILFAILAAACYGISSPISKLLLLELPPPFMAALLYLGAGLGMTAINLLRGKKNSEQKEAGMTKRELPYIIGMIVLDIAAPIALMLGLSMHDYPVTEHSHSHKHEPQTNEHSHMPDMHHAHRH